MAFSVLAVVVVAGTTIALFSPAPKAPPQKSSSVNPHLIHPQSDELIRAIRTGETKIPIGYHIEEDKTTSTVVLVRMPTQEEKTEMAQEGLKTSLKGGPMPEVLWDILSKWVKSDASFNQHPSRDMAGLYESGAISNRLTDVKLTNEHARSINGEKMFFYDLEVEVRNSYGPVRKEVSCSFVKRGKGWYLYSVNGKRLDDF